MSILWLLGWNNPNLEIRSHRSLHLHRTLRPHRRAIFLQAQGILLFEKLERCSENWSTASRRCEGGRSERCGELNWLVRYEDSKWGLQDGCKKFCKMCMEKVWANRERYLYRSYVSRTSGKEGERTWCRIINVLVECVLPLYWFAWLATVWLG